MMTRIKQAAAACVLLLCGAAASGQTAPNVKLDRAPDLGTDQTALQHGAKLFLDNCLSCHSARAVRYGQLAELGLTAQQLHGALQLAGARPGDRMTAAMAAADAQKAFGIAPPDLSDIVRARSSSAGSGADYLYTYLRSFYLDPGQPTGWNNKVYPNVAMPGVLGAPGTPELDRDAADLTAFLSWAADPSQQERKRLGVWVLLFLGAFFCVALGLHRAYWKYVR